MDRAIENGFAALSLRFNLKMHTLRKFRRYNKASLGGLVPLEILGKHQQGYNAQLKFLKPEIPTKICLSSVGARIIWECKESMQHSSLFYCHTSDNSMKKKYSSLLLSIIKTASISR